MASTSASPSLSASTLPSSVASNADDVPMIEFTNNTKALFEAVRRVPGDFAIIKGVSTADSEKLFLQERRPFRIRGYYADKRIMIIAIPTKLHETLHHGLWNRFLNELVRRNQEDSWDSIASTTFKPQGHPGSNGKESDSSGGPLPECGLKSSWPTLVIESGVSESLSELQRDMRWWFSASNHDVKIVLLTMFNSTAQSIIIQRWQEEPQNPRQGATNTRSSVAQVLLTPQLQQQITITRDVTTDTYHVTGGALVLSFQLLFLRNPGPNERDFIIDITQLQAYARRVWAAV